MNKRPVLYLLLSAFLVFFVGCAKNKQLDPEYLIVYNALEKSGSENYEIFTMDLDGSNKVNVTKNPAVDWSYMVNDGKIFFISDRDTSRRKYLLYEMAPDGKKIKQIADFLLSDSWMDSRKNSRELIVVPHQSTDSALWIINRTGDLLKKIYTPELYPANPAFSPDGSKIAFTGKSQPNKQVPGYEEEVFLMNDDGSDIKQLSKYPKNDTTAEWWAYKAGPPKWHPSGDFITYQSKQNGKYSLYAVSTDDSRQWKLTRLEHEEGWHDWSPDGKWLAIELFNPDQTRFHIGLMNWETKELSILTDSTYKYQQAPVFLELE